MIWPFRRKPAPPVHIGPTTVDWVPGDIAECIYPGPWFDENGPVTGPALGSRSIVADVFTGASARRNIESICLRFVGGERGVGWACVSFRKVVLAENGADRVVGVNRPVGREVDA